MVLLHTAKASGCAASRGAGLATQAPALAHACNTRHNGEGRPKPPSYGKLSLAARPSALIAAMSWAAAASAADANVPRVRVLPVGGDQGMPLHETPHLRRHQVCHDPMLGGVCTTWARIDHAWSWPGMLGPALCSHHLS